MAGSVGSLGPEGRYRLVRRIGVGGMGEVWEADDTVLGRRVALKVLVQELADDPRATRRFVREARATAKLTHPNVARVYDFGRDGGLPYLVMELLEGDTLADRVAGGPLPPSEAARIGAAVADALDAAHSRGIIHRDIKPSNVLLTAAGEVKVMDFGIAAAADETHSTTGSGLYGTAAYISPERAAGQPATPAADVYSLGAVLFELLTGRPPFLGDSPVLVVRAHLHERPRPVRELAPWVPARLADTCEAALAKDPAQRPSSAAALAIRLRAASSSPAGPVPGGGEVRTTRLRPAKRRDPASRQLVGRTDPSHHSGPGRSIDRDHPHGGAGPGRLASASAADGPAAGRNVAGGAGGAGRHGTHQRRPSGASTGRGRDANRTAGYGHPPGHGAGVDADRRGWPHHL